MQHSGLVSMDVMSKSDPVVLVYQRRVGHWFAMGQTEVIKNSHEPVFTTRVPLQYWSLAAHDTHVMLELYDCDHDDVKRVASNNTNGNGTLLSPIWSKLSSKDKMGEAFFKINDLLLLANQSPNASLTLPLLRNGERINSNSIIRVSLVDVSLVSTSVMRTFNDGIANHGTMTSNAHVSRLPSISRTSISRNGNNRPDSAKSRNSDTPDSPLSRRDRAASPSETRDVLAPLAPTAILSAPSPDTATASPAAGVSNVDSQPLSLPNLSSPSGQATSSLASPHGHIGTTANNNDRGTLSSRHPSMDGSVPLPPSVPVTPGGVDASSITIRSRGHSRAGSWSRVLSIRSPTLSGVSHPGTPTHNNPNSNHMCSGRGSRTSTIIMSPLPSGGRSSTLSAPAPIQSDDARQVVLTALEHSNLFVSSLSPKQSSNDVPFVVQPEHVDEVIQLCQGADNVVQVIGLLDERGYLHSLLSTH
jgi:hypothetical protein